MLSCASLAARLGRIASAPPARQLLVPLLAPRVSPAHQPHRTEQQKRPAFGLSLIRGFHRSGAVMAASLRTELVEVDNGGAEELNFILGQAHFIKTVDDLAEVLFQSGTAIKFGVAFCEASGDRKIRYDGNDDGLVELAKKNALAIGAGHSFIIFLRNAYPINVLKAVQNAPTVCRIYCATANPTAVVIGTDGGERRGILGVLDGFKPLGVEDEADIKARKDLLKMIGYKR